jgi:hypothetical protein
MFLRGLDMNEDQIYELKIDAFTPSTISMKRLAEYMAVFAGLLGEHDHIHFVGLEQGSARVLARCDSGPAEQIVRERLFQIEQGVSLPKDIEKSCETLIEYLTKDNADAEIIPPYGMGNVISIAGRSKTKPLRYGPFKQDISLEGKIYRLGGKDQTVPLGILLVDGGTESASTKNRQLAVELKKYLFEDIVLRLKGQANYFRNEDSGWQVESIIIDSFEELDSRALTEIVGDLKQIKDFGWAEIDDITKELRRIRTGGDV